MNNYAQNWVRLGSLVPDCWPPTAMMLAAAVSARTFTADPRIEVTLSPRLRTSRAYASQ